VHYYLQSAHGRQGPISFVLKQKKQNSREKNASTLPAIFASGTAEAKKSIPANAGPLFSLPHAR